MAADDKLCPVCQRAFGAGVLYCPVDGTPLVARRGVGPASRNTRNAVGATASVAATIPPVEAAPAPATAAVPIVVDAPTTSPKTMTGEESDPYIGLKILDQIVIDRLIGTGSMARVYRAFQAGVDRDVAVKILHRELSANPEIIERFHREAKLASRIDHPNVVRILLTAQLPLDGTKRGGELVLVMDHIEGESLLSRIQSAGRLPLGRALHIILQVCDAVGEAHAMGIVHRDIKPENILVLRRGDDPDFVKVVDFGLARLASNDATVATRAGAVFGSPRYISPEGAQGLPVGPAADVYSITTMLFQCLAGRTPFDADTPVGFLLAHANEAPASLYEFVAESEVPRSIVDVIASNLSKRPDDRAKDAGALARALIEAASSAGVLDELLPVRAPWVSSRASTSTGVSADTRPMAISRELAEQLDGGARGRTIISAEGDLDHVDGAFGSAGGLGAPRLSSIEASTPTTPPRRPGSSVESTLCDEVVDGAPVAQSNGTPPVAAGPMAAISPAAPTAPLPLVAIPPSASFVPAPDSSDVAPHAVRTSPRTIPPEDLPPSRVSLHGEPADGSGQRDSLPSTGSPIQAPTSPMFQRAASADATSDLVISAVSQRGTTRTPSPEQGLEQQGLVRRSELITAPGATMSTVYPDGDFRPESPWARWKGVAIVTACFVVGVGAASLGASRYRNTGVVQLAPADALLADIQAAEARGDWGDPELRLDGVSVRDLIHRARSEFPDDARFIDVQRAAAASVLTRSLAERREGRLDSSLALAKLALAISPDDAAAYQTVRELTSTAPSSAPTTTSSDRPRSPTGPRATTSGAGVNVPVPTAQPAPSTTSGATPKPTGTTNDPASQRASDGGTWLLRNRRFARSRHSSALRFSWRAETGWQNLCRPHPLARRRRPPPREGKSQAHREHPTTTPTMVSHVTSPHPVICASIDRSTDFTRSPSWAWGACQYPKPIFACRPRNAARRPS